jgi:CubicO group peptidase (beta-lactamase class C family)
MLGAITKRVEQAIQERVFPGCVIGIVKKTENSMCFHSVVLLTIPTLHQYKKTRYMMLRRSRSRTYFSEGIIDQMTTNQIPELNESTGLGWELNQPRYMGTFCGPHTFGKTGFTGTLCVGDIEKEIAYVILSNRTFPKRPIDSSAINALRADIGELVLSV